MKIFFYSILAIVFLMLVWVAVSLWSERGVKEPSYTIEKEAEGYEIRNYESYILAEARIPPGVDDPLSEGFRLLFDYISGANTGSQKIKMTAPVLQQENLAEKIAMTKPVLSLSDQKGSLVSFVLPAEYELQTAPSPTNPAIQIREITSRRVAVIRFYGYANDAVIDKNRKKLISFLARDGVEMKGDLIAAYYNPPWTPPFMRRNEIMVNIE